MDEAVRVWIACGANLGDREENIRRGIARLAAAPGVDVLRRSELRQTAPEGGGPPQPDYLNGVIECVCSLTPAALLELCKACEREAGRDFTTVRNGPRPLDLDILAYGDLRVDSRDLVVPHPRWHERDFVLEPLRELGVDCAAWPRHDRPRVVESAAAMRELSRTWVEGRCVRGVVPTMGALHAGHAALFERARAECDRVVVTIFVNPLQFDDGADLEAYPRTMARDLEICAASGVDAVYVPQSEEVYPPGFASHIAVGAEADGMEGASRAGHFAGVATVVAKLLIAAGCDRAYFGEKDAQQLAVIRRLVVDLELGVAVVGCPIVREEDGVALSSRNARLGPRDRIAARVLWRALDAARRRCAGGERDADALCAVAQAVLSDEPLCAVEYVELRSLDTLGVLGSGAVPERGARMLIAAAFDEDSECPTRLIDNAVLTP